MYIHYAAAAEKPSPLCGYNTTCHGQDKRCSENNEHRTSTCNYNRSADICHSQTYSVAGTFLRDSGWTGALTESGVASAGTADSFLSAASLTKTRQAHQVTACSLYKLLKSAYSSYLEELEDPTDAKSFEDSCEHRKLQSPQFRYWNIVLTRS